MVGEHQHPHRQGTDPRDFDGPFRHVIRVEVRFADTDAMVHVNNAVYLTYCESARIRYWTDVTGEPVGHGVEHPESLILAEARIAYRAQVFHGEVVTVETRTSRIGRTSFTLQHRLLAAPADETPRLVAVSESVLVRYDYASAAPTPIGAAHVAAMETWEGHRLRDPD